MKRNLKIIIWAVVLILGVENIFVSYAFARRIKQTTDIFVSVKRYLQDIGYNNKQAAEMSQALKQLFPSLEEIKVISDLPGKIRALANSIKEKIGYDKDDLSNFELPEVIRDKKASCLGYAQLVYVLGKTIGLDVEAIVVYVNHYQNHIANIIKVDSGYIILDLTNNSPSNFYLSPGFNWGKAYKKLGEVWVLNAKSGIYEFYDVVQRIDSQGLISAKDIVYGSIKSKSRMFEEAIEDFARAGRRNPKSAQAFYYSGIAKFEFGSYKFNEFKSRKVERAFGDFYEAISDFDQAIKLNPIYAEAFFTRGLANFILGKVDEALKDIKRAVELEPDLNEKVPIEIRRLLGQK